MKKILFFVLAFAFFFCPAFAGDANNVTELRIEEMQLVSSAGSVLNFSFSAGNRVGPECAAQISYWVESDGKKLSQGTDSFFLGQGETKAGKGTVLLPSKISGVLLFFMQMQCNAATVLANKTIEVNETVPAMPLFSDVVVGESGDGKQLGFSYTLSSSRPGLFAFQVEEQLLQSGVVVWENKQSVAVDGSVSLNRFGPVLSQGSYTLTVRAVYGGESAEVSRHFSVVPVAAPFPFLQVIAFAAFALLLFSAVFVAAKFISPARALAKRPVVPPAPMPFKAGLPKAPVQKILKPVVQKLLLFESQSSGIPGELEISGLLDKAGLKGEEREKALLSFVGRVALQQSVKCYVVSREQCGSGFETVVSFSIVNNSNRNWLNVVVLARLPKFLGRDVLSIASDTKTIVKKQADLLQFRLQKVRAMQSATVSCSFDRLVSQPEANTVPLPLVIGFGESEPLVITEVKVEQPVVLEPAEPAEKELKAVALKKPAKKAKPAKKSDKGKAG